MCIRDRVTADEYGAIMDEYGPAVLNSPDLTGTELMEDVYKRQGGNRLLR